MLVAHEAHIELVEDLEAREEYQQDVCDKHRHALVHLLPDQVHPDVVDRESKEHKIEEAEDDALGFVDEDLGSGDRVVVFCATFVTLQQWFKRV